MPQLETYYLNGPDLASSTAIFTDIGMDTCAPDGFYSDENIARELINCVLQAPQNCPEECVEPSFFRTFKEEDPCNTFCQYGADFPIDVEFTTVSGNGYTQIVIGDEIVEPLTPEGEDGFYAVYEFVSSTLTYPFKILEMEGQFIVNILECGIGNSCDTL